MTPLNRARLIRVARIAAYAALALVALVVAAALLVPAFLDTQRVEAELQAKLSQALHGEVVWDKLEIRLLPSPRGALSRVRADIPKTVSVRAAEVEAHLSLLPLLRGRAEIASVSLSKPVISLEIAAPSAQKKEREEEPADPIETYRSVLEGLQRIAPEAVLDVEDADLDVRAPGMPALRVSKLGLHAKTGSKGLEIELSADSEYWSGLKLSGQIAFPGLSGRASLKVAEARPQAWLDYLLAKAPLGVAIPAASLRAEARTDGKAALECDFDLGAPAVAVRRAAEQLQLADLAVAGKVSSGKEGISLNLKNARLGASKLADGSLRYSSKGDVLSAATEFDLDLAQAMDGTRRMLAEEAGDALAAIDPVTGRARGKVRVNASRSGWNVRVEIAQSDSSIGLKGAPGPIKVKSVSLDATSGSVKIDRADLSVLDANAVASATIAYARQLWIEGAVSEGSVGENTLAWVWKTAELPPRLALKGPIRIAVKRASWAPKQPLGLEATAQFDAGPKVSVDLGWTPDALEIRRATVKDGRSDAALALRTKASLIEGRFSGALYSTSVASALKSAKLPSGGASGELGFSFDRRHPERISAEGRLTGEAIDLEWLLGRPVRIDSVDLEAGAGSMRIRAADLNWAEQRIRLQGNVKYGGSGPVVDAQLDSPGVVVDALFPRAGGEEKPKDEKRGDDDLSKWFPLPVAGRIAVRSDFVQSGRFKVAPFAAALALEAKKAHLDLQKAKVCGLSLPLTADATPEGLALEVHIAAKQQPLEETARCLTERGVQMTGSFDLGADLRTRGEKLKSDEFKRNLDGSIRAESRDGRVMKFALLGNILSLKGVADLLKEGEAKVDSTGFPYRRLSAAGRFAGGKFIVDESGFDSSALGLAATGWISIVDYKSELSVLVAPFARVDRVARKVPIVGYIMGGALTSIPVGVSGDIRNPLVVPLGPGAVTSELLGIFERTIKLPEKLVPPQRGDALSQPPSVP